MPLEPFPELPAERRHDDPRINRLVADVDALKVEMTRNTAVTEQVRDILATFKVLFVAAKWVAAIAAAWVAVKAALHFGNGR
jgi:hypothetical protein